MGGRLRSVVAIAAAATAGVLAPAAHGASGGWVPTLPLEQQTWQQLSAFPDGTGYVLDRGNSITLWHTGDYGVAWDALTYLPAGTDSFVSIRFAGPELGYAVDGDTLLRTTDGATTAHSWQALPKPHLPKHDWMFGRVLGVTGTTVAVGGERMHPLHLGCNDAAGEYIWTSHDGGRHWLTATLPKNTDVNQIDYLDRRLGVAVVYDLHDDPSDSSGCQQIGDRTSLFVTRDGGRHFTRAFRCGDVDHGLCWSAKFLTASTIVAGRNDGGIVVSRDGGRTFTHGPTLQGAPGHTDTKQDEAFWVQGFDFSGQVIYATTKFAGAFRSSDFGHTWTRETSCDSAYSLGIGEVAAFDRERAIAGGPTCIATRMTSPAAAPAATAPARASAPYQLDVVQRAAGQVRTVDDGLLRVSR